MSISIFFPPVNRKNPIDTEYRFTRKKKEMSSNATFAFASGVEPMLPAPPAASPIEARLLHEREEPTSPEKKEVHHITKIKS